MSVFGFPAAPGPLLPSFLPPPPRSTATSSALLLRKLSGLVFLFALWSIWASWLQKEKPGLISPLAEVPTAALLGLVRWRGAWLQESFRSPLHTGSTALLSTFPRQQQGQEQGRGWGHGALRHTGMLSTA